jgi:hypothetical protein
MIMRLALPAAVATIATVACSSGGAPSGEDEPVGRTKSAITSGAPTQADAGVVSIQRQGIGFCTGTIVSTRTVVTASHCVAGDGPDAVVSAGRRLPVSYVLMHPGFDPVTLANDLAILVLGVAVDPALASPLLDGSLDGDVGAIVRIVGFGATSADAGSTPVANIGTARVEQLDPLKFVVKPAPSLPCVRDSGGPAFLLRGGWEFLAGVVSSGDPTCVDHGTYVRVDAYRGWLAEQIARAEPRTRATGEPCLHSESCADGGCFAPPDAMKRPYCTKPCIDDAGCPSAMSCRNGTCTYPAPSPGAFNSLCTDDADCELGICASRETSSGGRCAIECGASVSSCGFGPCEKDARNQNRWACFSSSNADTSGCAIARAPSSDSALAISVGIACALLVTRRKRERESGSAA